MGLLDIIRKPKPQPKPQPNSSMVASQAEFITALLLNDRADLPLPQSEQDEARKNANVLAVSIFRNIYRQQDIGPSPEMSDALILDVYRKVGCALREAAKERGEFVESAIINRVALEFLDLYRMLGASIAEADEGASKFLDDHLEIEIQNYKRAGLGFYSQRRLDLFGQPSEPPPRT